MLVALLAACGTTQHLGQPPENGSRLPPGNAQRDGPDAHPPANLESVPDAVPQIEPIRIGGPNKPYELAGHTYTPMTEDRPFAEKGLASWYGKKFHGHRTASGEAYNMYAMTAAHRTLPIPSYARVRNPANGREVIVRVNDRGPFSSGRVIDLSYTAALKLGILGGVQPVEVERITGDDIRTGAAFRASPAYASASAPAPAAPGPALAVAAVAPIAGVAASTAASAVALRAPTTTTLSDSSPTLLPPRTDAAAASAPSPAVPAQPATAALTLTLPDGRGDAVASAGAASALIPAASAPAELALEQGQATTAAGAGFWIQLGAYRERTGALDFQHRLIDEQPWLAPLLAVFTDHGLNKLQAGPYPTRTDAKSAAERIRVALQLVPTIVEKR